MERFRTLPDPGLASVGGVVWSTYIVRPSPDDLEQMFTSLTKNGLEFVCRSVMEVEADPGFAVSHFAVGVELLLKARLFREHWAFVADNPHTAAWTALKDGTQGTVPAGKLVAAITSVTGTSLRAEKAVFAKLFQHRNRVLHFVPAPTVDLAVLEQFLGWYHLHRLLTVTWRDLFAGTEEKIKEIDLSVRAHRKFLEVRFQQLTAEGVLQTGRFLNCPVCNFESCGATNVHSLFEVGVCRVCDASVELLNFGCCPPILAPEDRAFHGGISCGCGQVHTAEEAAAELGGDAGWAANCLACHRSATVAEIGGGLQCLGCGCDFLESECYGCPICAQCWAGVEPDDGWAGCPGCDHRTAPWDSR